MQKLFRLVDMNMMYLCVKLLEGVLAGEEIQIDVQDIWLGLTHQRRYSLHNITCGSFVIVIHVKACPIANLCWLQRVGTS